MEISVGFVGVGWGRERAVLGLEHIVFMQRIPFHLIPPNFMPSRLTAPTSTFVQVISSNAAGVPLGTVLFVIHARSSVFLVEHTDTKVRCYIRRSEVKSLD